MSVSPPANAASADALPLPPLRADLELLPGAADVNGQPTWLIHDPLMNRFTQIQPPAYEALKYWSTCSSVGELVARVNAEGRAQLEIAAVVALIDFLFASQLTEHPKAGGWQSFVRSKSARKQSLPAWLVHHYLFFRIPLIKPQAILERSLPVARLLWSRPVRVLCVMMGLAGLYLASRQWEHFVTTLMSYFSWEGIVTGSLALGFVKLAHELGHAYAAAHFGCRVHTMGIAFVVMAPLPYTDVTDSWRLTDRRKRLLIDSAGIITEAVIAAVALFVWSFLPDGPVRSAAFVLSAVSVMSSLAINLNPFMRFDGYYLLSEMLGVENLQSRAFAVGRWKLREVLFGLGVPCPESMPERRLAMLIVYAWAIWIYRLIVFTGIALLVYHYFFKVLGIVLFAVEIIFFIARPIVGELLVWWKMRSSILVTHRTKITLGAAALTILAFVVPWSTSVEIPAVLEASELQSIYPSRPAQIASVSVQHGDPIKLGATIATLSSPDLDDELVRTRISLQVAEIQFARRMADAADRESSLVLASTIEALKAKIAGLQKERAELTITAPFDGKIVDLNPELTPGRWVSPRDLIAVVADDRSLSAQGYMTEADISRLSVGGQATFI
ncbi:MAG: HlyD family efflux transporter periplasmic adaptor subunit, partial [Proteobacteria bacterium]|nr:HlyD family efflux transporter periplasmic adaptor subunit [Pseudomonadota bacterium]